MFSLRVLTADSYQNSPISGYDHCYSDFRGCEIYNVPVLTLFGTTQAGQKGAVHVHGVFPYLYLRWKDVFPGISTTNCRRYLQELALEIDKALNVEAVKSNSNKHHVHNITIEKKRSIYGFYAESEDFLKVSFYYPWDTSKVASLLYQETILNKFIQPYEAHFPYGFQFFVDYNLFGMNTINLSAFKFRTPNGITASPSKTNFSISSFLSDSSPSYCKIWNVAALSSSQVNGIPKRVVSELEVDCRENAVVNKYGVTSCIGRNPGLVEIQEDLKHHRRLADEASQMTPIPTQERDVEVTASEMFYKELMMKVIKKKKAAADILMEESDTFDDSQRSFFQSSLSESFGLSTTQDKDVLKMLVNMYNGPEDDSVLATQHESDDDDDDEITKEMSQPIVDDVLNSDSSSHDASRYPISVNSADGFHINVNGEAPSQSQGEFRMAQVDGAYDDENFENGPRLLKQENVNVNTEFNEEPPVLHPIHPLENFDLEPDWTKRCSVKVTDIGTVDSSRPIPLADLANGSNVRKSKKLQVPVVRKSGLSKKKKMTVDPCVETLLSDLISKVVEQESELMNSDLKVNNDYLQKDCKPSLSKSDKPLSNAYCFQGARPKTKNNIFSSFENSSFVIKNSSADKITASEYESQPSKSTSWNDLTKPSEQVKLFDNKHSTSRSSSKHSNALKASVRNGEFKVISSKEPTPAKEEVVEVVSKKKDKNYRRNEELSNSNFGKLKKSSSYLNEFPTSPAKSSDLVQSFGFDKSMNKVNFSKLGREAVVIQLMTKEEIDKKCSNLNQSGCNKLNQKLTHISEQTSTECKESQIESKDDRKRYKMFDKNKLKTVKSNSLDGKDLSEINSDCTSSKELSNSEINLDCLKNYKKYSVDSDHSSLMQVSSKRATLNSTDSKKSKSVFNNVITALCPSEISDKKTSAFSKSLKNSSFNNGMFTSQDDVLSSEPKAPTAISLINAKEPDDDFDFRVVYDPDVRNQENISKPSQSSVSTGSLPTSTLTLNLKPDFQKSLKHSDHKSSSKHKHKDKNSTRQKDKKKSAHHSDKKLNGKYGLFTALECDSDFKKDSETAFKNSLHERNVDYFPKAKAMSPGVKPLINSVTKMLRNEQSLNSNVKPKATSSSHEIIMSSETENTDTSYSDIIKNSPLVRLYDCKKLIEQRYPENLPFLLKKNSLLQSKEHRKLSRSKSVSKSESKRSHTSKRSSSISGVGSSNKGKVKRLTNDVQKTKNIQLAGNATVKGKNPEYPKLDVHSLPFAVKSKPGTDDVSHFPGKPKSRPFPSGVLNSETESQDVLAFAVKSKPSFKSKSLADSCFKSELSGVSVNQKSKTNKPDIKIKLDANFTSSQSAPKEGNKSLTKSKDFSFPEGIPKNSRKSSSDKSSKFKLNNHKLPDSDFYVKEEVENKMSSEPSENSRRRNKNGSNSFKNSSADVPIKDNCDPKPKTDAQKGATLEKAAEVKPPKETHKPKPTPSNSFDNSIITINDLYDTVKRRTASKNQFDSKLPLKADSSKPLNNNKTGKALPSSSRAKTSKKNASASRNDNSSTASAKSGARCPPVCEKADSLSLSKEKDSVCVSDKMAFPVIENRASVPKTATISSSLSKIEFPIKEAALNSSVTTTDYSAMSGIHKTDENTKPQNNKREDTEPQINKSEDTKPQNNGTEDTKPQNNGSGNTKPQSKETENTKPQNKEIENTKPQNNESEITKPLNNESEITKPHNNENEITNPQNNENKQKPCIPSASNDSVHTDIPSTNNLLCPIPGTSNGVQSTLLPQIPPPSVSQPSSTSKTILSRPSKGRTSKMSGISNNFGFFSSKTPLRNRRCQNDTEGLQFPKPMSSRLSLKLNKKSEVPNERKDSYVRHDSRTRGKNNTLIENSTSQCFGELASSERSSNRQASEKYVLPLNIKIKVEPPDDYEKHKSSDISDALKRFDFDENSSSDPASYTFSHSKRTRNQKDQKNLQITQQSRHRRNASRTQNSAQFSPVKSEFNRNTSSNNNSTNDRYPKRNCPVSSTIEDDDDDVVILEEAPCISSSTSRRTRRSSRLLSSNNSGPKEVIDLENEDNCINVAPIITIKRDSDGNNSIVPNKRCSSSTINLGKPECQTYPQRSASSSSSCYAADSSDALASRNSAEDILSSPDSKHGLKLKLKLKTILTRNNEPKIVVVGKTLDGEGSDEEIDSNAQNPAEVAIKTEEVSEMKSSKRRLGVRSSKRKSKANVDAQYVPPLLIKDIKKEKIDDYEQPYVQPLRFSLSAINAGQKERPSTSFEPKCEPLKLYRKLNNFYVDSDASNKRRLPNTTDESSDNVAEVQPKRRRGRPAKVNKSAPAQHDLSPLKNNTSFNENSSAGCSSTHPIPKISAEYQPLDISRRCSFPISDNIEECSYEKVGPGLKFDWVTLKIKQEVISDPEDAGKVDDKNANSTPPLESCASVTTSRRRNSLRCESFKKFFDSGSDEDTKPKIVVKPQKKKSRSKSANTEANVKTAEQPSTSRQRTRTRSGGYKNYPNGDKDGNSSDSDCKVVGGSIVSSSRMAPRRRRGRPPLSRNRQMSTDSLPSCNPCSVTLERLSPSLLEQGDSTRKSRKMSNGESSSRPNLNNGFGNGNQIVPDVNSDVAPSCPSQNREPAMAIPSSIGKDITGMNQAYVNTEKSDFEVLHNKVMGEKISPVLQPSQNKNPCPKFIPDSGPVTINGLNSIDIDSNFSELLCEKEIPDKMNCSSFMYNSSLNPDNNILSNRNSNFLRPPPHETDQRVFESPSNVLKSGSMDCESPLLYSHSPVTDAKHLSEFSPDSKFLHLNHSSPQAYKRQQDFTNSPVMNSDPIFDHCNSPLNEVIIAHNKNELLKTQDKDFNRTMQQRDVNSYYSSSSDSYNEGCRTDPSVIHKSKTKSNMFANVTTGVPDPLHGNDFNRGQQKQDSPYSFENNSADQNGELPFHASNGFGSYDKISSGQHDPLKYHRNSYAGRKESMNSCFPSKYSESRKPLPTIPEQGRPTCEGSSRESSHYSRFPSGYGSPVGIQQQPYPAHNQNSFGSSFRQRTDESLNSFRNHNEYYDRMKWEDTNVSSFSNTNDSYSEDCKSPYSSQPSRYDSYYTKNSNDLNENSRINRDPYYRQKWPEINAPYYQNNDRSLASQNERSMDGFSLRDRPGADTFRSRPPEAQPESSKYDSSFPNINSQVSDPVTTSSRAYDRTKDVDGNFSHFSSFDCNRSDPKELQNTVGKKFENTFDKNMDVFFNQHGFSSASSDIQSPSPVSRASPQVGANSSPFSPKIPFNKKMDFNSESNDGGRKYLEACKPSPCSSLSDNLDSVQSPSVINNSPLCIPNRPVSVLEEFKMQEIMEELSSPCIESTSEANNSPDIYDQTQSPNNSREVLTVSSDSGDTGSVNSPECFSKKTKTSANECEQDVKTFEMALDSVREDSFHLLSERMISEDESFLMDENIFPSSPQNKVDENAPNPVDSDACNIPKNATTENSSAQSAEMDQTDLNYAGCNFKILDFQECLTESDTDMQPFLGDLSYDFLSQDSSSITNKENDSNICVAAADVSVKDNLSDSAQIANKTPNSNGCPLFVETVPNLSVIVTNPPSSISDTPNSFVPLESLKNSIMPVVTVSNTAVNEPVCSTSNAFTPINQTFLSTLMVNESVVLPQPNFFFNNASIIIGDGASVEQDCINVFQSSNSDKNYTAANVSQVNSKDSQEVQNLKKSFNGADDILSMIVKSCDIGEEFDENFDSPVESANNANAAEPNLILSATESTDGATNSISNSFPVSVEKITISNQNLASNSEQKIEPTVLSGQINERQPNENGSPAMSSPNQSLDSSQDKENINQSGPLDSMIHSFYGDDTLYGLNASGNCDSLSVSSDVQIYNASIVDMSESIKDRLKLRYSDYPEKYDKGIAILSPSQSKGLPFNGKRMLKAKTRNLSLEKGSSKLSAPVVNDKLEFKKAADSSSNKKNEVVDPLLVKPDDSPPHYDKIIGYFSKPGEVSSTCSSPGGPSSQRSEPTQVQSQPFSPSENQFAQNSPNTVSQQFTSTPSSRNDHGVLRQLLSKGVTLESTPSTGCKTRVLDKLLLSPISKDNLLTSDTKRKRKLSFDATPKQPELPENKKLKEVHERSWKKSFIADQSRDNVGNLTSSEIDGPTLINSRDFRINVEDCERVRHEAQHLTIMSLELHVNTRNTLSPDPEHDPVAVIFYTIYNEVETFEQEVVGMIALDSQSESSNLRSTHTSLRNYLSLVPGVKTCQVTCVRDEKLLFEKLVSVVREWDPDIMIGYEIQMASWGYLIERANYLKLNLISMLSRLCSEKKENRTENVKEDNTVADQTADTDRINIPGRIVLNVWRLLRKEVTLNVYTFENLYYHVLHIRTPKFSFHDLTQWYCGLQKETVVKYYVTRILGTVQILDKLDLIRRTSELARLFGIQFYEVLSRGSQFRVESMMLRTAAPMGFVPVSPSVQQRSHSRAPECVPLVLEPESKFYEDPVVVLDFQSLYPSMIIAYNYCFSTCLGRIQHFGGNDVPFEFGCTSLNVPMALLQKLFEEDNIHFTPQGIAFVKSNVRRGILPTMLEEILDTRVMVKQSMKKIKGNSAYKKLLDARQLGLKLIANVTYGYTGASYSGRMPCVEVADGIVGKARETLERAIRLIEDTPEWGARVVYGDTDSLFILLPGRTKEQAFKLGQEMADAVTKTNPKPVKLKFEKVYLPCVLQTKKRYVGFMYETVDQKKATFDAKGIETVRRDSCPATAKILEKTLKILFETRDINSAKSYVQKQFRKVLDDRISLMDFIFAKEYRGSSGYRPGACVPALEIAKRRRNKDPRSEPRNGERVPYVVVYGLPGLPIIRLVHEPGDLIMNTSLRINTTYYITRVISPPLERVFSLMGANVKTWFTAIAHTQKLNLPMLSHQPRETITQYFITRNCPSCECPTTSSLCDGCRLDPAGTAADLQDKIRKWERAVNRLNQICVSCTKSNSSVDRCLSMDCPVLFKLNLARKDFSQAPYLRKVLTQEIF